MAENKLNKLTPDDLAQLYQYSRKMDELDAREPEDKDGEAWKEWKQDVQALVDEYGGVYGKFLWSTHEEWKEDPTKAADVLKYYLATNGDFILQDNPGSADALHTQLEALARYGFMKDKTSKEMIARQPEVLEIDGQLKFFWGIEQVPDRAMDGKPFAPVTIALTGEGTRTNRKITGDDDAVFTAACNMIYAGRQRKIKPPYFVTPQDIWRRMNGITDSGKGPSKKQLDAVNKSLDKMRFTKLFMDISQEVKATGIAIDDDRLTEGVVEDYYLPAAKVTFRSEKGKELTGYRFDRMPFLYEYNIAKGHVLLVDYDLLDTTDTTGNEGNTIAFRNYLLREIALMYDGGRNNNRILYATMYEATATPTPEERVRRSKYKTEESYNTVIRRKAKDDRDKVDALLESWKRKKWIKNYKKAQGSGRKIIGVDIILNPDNYTNEIQGKL